MNPLLSVIVLLYQGDRYIDTCFESLANQSLPRGRYEIILADNGGSTPAAGKYQKEKYTKIARFPKNFGFAGGNNRALEYADGDYVLLLNQDVIAHHDCLRSLLDAFQQVPDAGAFASSMIMVSAEDRPNRLGENVQNVGYFRITPYGYASYHLEPVDRPFVATNFVSGNGICLRKDILGTVGSYLFDDRLVNYAEDLDLSIRFQNHHLKMYVCAKSVIYHFRDTSFSGSPLKMATKFVAVSSNRLYVYWKHLSFFKFLLRLPLLLVGVPLKIARPDGDARFQTGLFALATCLLPVVLADFFQKVIRFHKRKYSITQAGA